MIQTPVIVTFANQKGGVGKTTLCISFANYLVMKGAKVIVVDCDFQHSIVKSRKSDLKKYGAECVPYDVLTAESTDRNAMTTLIERLHNDPSIEVALIDSPGHLQADGLPPLFVNSDILAVPFHYDPMTVPSTVSFLYFIERLRNAMGGKMGTKIFIIPNLCDARVGTRAELLEWEKKREKLSAYGFVTPKIHERADMERVSTIASLDRQIMIVTPVFDRIYSEIFGCLEPRRSPSIEGIQLYENIDPKGAKRMKDKSGSGPPEIQSRNTDTNTPETNDL